MYAPPLLVQKKMFTQVSRITLNAPITTNETVLHGRFSKIRSHMALSVNSLLCNLPHGRTLLNMQISIASHFIFICYPVLMVKL